MKLQHIYSLVIESYKLDISPFYEKDTDDSLYFNLSKGIKIYQKELPILFELLEGKYASKWIVEWFYDEENAEKQQENVDWVVNKWCVPLQEQYDKIKKFLETLGKKHKVELRLETPESLAKQIKEDTGSEYFGENGWQKLLKRMYVTIVAGNVQMGVMFDYGSKKFEEFELSPFDEYSPSDAEDYEKVINVINKITLKKGKKKRFYSSQPQDRIAIIKKSSRLFDNMYIADSRSVADKYWVHGQDRSIISFIIDDLNVVNLGSGEYSVIGNPEISNIQIYEH